MNVTLYVSLISKCLQFRKIQFQMIQTHMTSTDSTRQEPELVRQYSRWQHKVSNASKEKLSKGSIAELEVTLSSEIQGLSHLYAMLCVYPPHLTLEQREESKKPYKIQYREHNKMHYRPSDRER